MAWRGFKPVDVPESGVHPLVRRVFEEMNHQKMSTLELAVTAGLSASGIKQWRYRRSPRLDHIEACLNVLGYEIRLHEIEKKP